MSTRFSIDTVIAVLGFVFLMLGVYDLLGRAVALILLGITLVFVGIKLEVKHDEPESH